MAPNQNALSTVRKLPAMGTVAGIRSDLSRGVGFIYGHGTFYNEHLTFLLTLYVY